MKILIVSQSFYPDTFAINDAVKILVERGHEVTVLTGLPDYTTSEIPEEYRNGKNRHQIYSGAEVIRVPTIARKHGPIWRSLNYLSFVWNGCSEARKRKWNEFDVIYVWEVSPVTMALPAISLKKRYKKPLYLYCMDIWPECIKAMGFRENTPFYKIINRISMYIYNQCDCIAVSSKPFLDYLEEVNGCDREKMCYIPQFASSSMLSEDFEKKPDGHTDFLYIGNIGKAQDMPCMIKAIAMLKERNDVTFHIIGGGSEYGNVLQMAKRTGADRVIKFYGPKPFKEAMQYYKKADACIITLDGSNRIGDTLPGKVQTYMAAGKPIIGAMNGAGKEIVLESNSGICVSAGDYKKLGENFASFADGKMNRNEYGINARKYFMDNFTEEKHFSELEKGLWKLIKNESIVD